MLARGGPGRSAGLRRAEVLAALSIAIDLGLGLPAEHVLRSARIAALLADRLGLDAEQRACVYYTNLVLWIGCHADSHEFSRWFGDDLAMRRDSYGLDWSGPPYLLYLLRRTGSERPPTERARLLLALLVTPRRRMAALIHSHCLSAGLMAEHIGLDVSVREAVECSFERWDGSGPPGRTTRVPTSHCHPGGPAGRDRRGAPADVRRLGRLAMARRTGAAPSSTRVWWRSSRGVAPTWPAWPRATPGPRRSRSRPTGTSSWTTRETDAFLRAMGDFVDLKCPFTGGSLAGRGGSRCGCSGPARTARHRRRRGTTCRVRARPRADGSAELGVGEAGSPHRVGPGADPALPLPHRPHPEPGARPRRPSARSPSCTASASTGPGYPRGLSGAALPMTQRLLAAADSYQGSLEQRPHRPALAPADAATRLARRGQGRASGRGGRRRRTPGRRASRPALGRWAPPA